MKNYINYPILQSIELDDELTLTNRIAMAPMTRGRVKNVELIPTQLQADYYQQRAGAGLIISEGTWISEQAISFPDVPGIYTDAQIKGWRLVTNAVHKAGGKMFLQLGHPGALSHPDFQNGELPVSASAVNPNQTAFTPNGPKPTVVPRSLTQPEIKAIVQDYKKAAENVKLAGFDGVELHIQHPSIISQFLSDSLNKRTDEYGGSISNKSRFLFEVLDAVINVWSSQRVSVKINPFLNYSGNINQPEDSLSTYLYVAEKLNGYPIAFLHILDRREPEISDEEYSKRKVFETFRPVYKGLIMANGGLTPESANAILNSSLADMVSFGTSYISNPDLVERLRENAPLATGNPETFFVGNENGYTDYPAYENKSV